VKKVLLIILGILLGLCGIGSICLGGLALGAGGTSGSIESSYHSLSTQTVGYVSDPSQIENSSNLNRGGLNVTLKVDARDSTKPLFLGVGPTQQVNDYLAGAPVEKVTDLSFSPFKLTTTTVAGSTQPAAPGDQAFWVAKATGVNPALSWKFTDGNYEVVIMNADGSVGTQADVRIGVKAPVLGKFAIGGLIFGIIAALVGLALLIWGIRTRRKNGPPTTGYPGTSYTGTPGPGYPGPVYPGPNSAYLDANQAGPITGYPPTNPYPQPGAQPPTSQSPPSAQPPASQPPSAQPPASQPPSTGWQPGPPEDPTAPRP
jgi:hypothetical protein